MKDSSQSGSVVAWDKGRFIQAAHQRVEEMGSMSIFHVDPPTAAELQDLVGDKVEKFELWGENWRNRIYRVELTSERVVLAKQNVWGTEAMLRYQHDQLSALSSVEVDGLRIPKPLALFAAKRVLVMEFARGKPITALVLNHSGAGDLPVACALAGKILAQIQILWTQQIRPMPVEALVEDFASAPWHLSTREEKILRSTLEILSRTPVAIGQLYYDYKAANLLFDNGELFLVDPPDKQREGAHLWDFASFRSSMRRHLWRFSLRHPFDYRNGLIRHGMAAFERAYLANLRHWNPDPALFAAATWIFELQRTAVLMTMQLGKIKLARQKKPIARGGRLGNFLGNRMTLPLLEIEKRWLFRKLAHSRRN